MDERSGCAEQVLASSGTGLQRGEVIQEVVQDLVHELLGQIFPSSAGELLGDIINSALYIDWYELYPQAGGKSYGNVRIVDRMGGGWCFILTGTVGRIHARAQGDRAGGTIEKVLGKENVTYYPCG